MAIYHLSSIRVEAARPVSLSSLADAAQRLASRFTREVSDWHTRRVLEALPRETLEDIGVPHYDVSPRAGALNRYPDIIEPERRR